MPILFQSCSLVDSLDISDGHNTVCVLADMENALIAADNNGDDRLPHLLGNAILLVIGLVIVN